MLEIFSTLGWQTIIVIGFAAVVTSVIHGATGVAGGFLMTAVLALIIGAKPVVPVMSVALLISHSTRAFLNLRDLNKTAFFAIILPSTPCIILSAWAYGKLSSSTIAMLLGVVILSSIPLRHWARSRKIQVGKRTLNLVATGYGFLSGVSIGSGMLLIPFAMGFGLAKGAFVATLAAIAFTTNITRTAVYGTTSLLDSHYLLLGIFVGVMTIPGNWIGRSVLRRITSDRHEFLVDFLTIIGALNFFWIAYK